MKNKNTVVIPFTLGAVSKKTSVPKGTLRYWQDRHNLFKPIAHDEQGNPLYSPEVVERIKKIKLFRNSGLEIGAVKNRLRIIGNSKRKKRWVEKG
ncbi:MAG TPA: hypothetical protein DHV62_04980 [Elusimicrobia bacterium]|jgi:DNA-binding transcriptional MerR regulator|nr:hypothetical protein [Elusimicrobiota bacterium]